MNVYNQYDKIILQKINKKNIEIFMRINSKLWIFFLRSLSINLIVGVMEVVMSQALLATNGYVYLLILW